MNTVTAMKHISDIYGFFNFNFNFCVNRSKNIKRLHFSFFTSSNLNYMFLYIVYNYIMKCVIVFRVISNCVYLMLTIDHLDRRFLNFFIHLYRRTLNFFRFSAFFI